MCHAKATKLSGSREGFTLVELLIAIVITGLLLGIVVSRMWVVKQRSHYAAVKSDLRNATLLQEKYFNENQAYATDVLALPDMTLTDGVSITVTWTATNGWAATGTHTGFESSGQCGYFTGPAPSGSADPATQPGIITCDE